MLASTISHLAIIDRHGAEIHGNVVYVQPREERWLEEIAEMHLMSRAWLEQYPYSAIYHTAREVIVGFFTAHTSKVVEGSGYLYEGMFEKAGEERLF